MKIVCLNCRKTNNVPEPLPRRGAYQCGPCKKPLSLENELTRRKARCEKLASEAFEICRILGRQTARKPPTAYLQAKRHKEPRRLRKIEKGELYAALEGGFEYAGDVLQIIGFGVELYWYNEILDRRKGEPSRYVRILFRGEEVLSTGTPGNECYYPGDWETRIEELAKRAPEERNRKKELARKAAAEDEKRRFGM